MLCISICMSIWLSLTLIYTYIYRYIYISTQKNKKKIALQPNRFQAPPVHHLHQQGQSVQLHEFCLILCMDSSRSHFLGEAPFDTADLSWHMQLHIIYQTCTNIPSWWFQLLWKICSSKWVHLHQIGMKIKNIWSFTTQIQTIFLNDVYRSSLEV